MEKPLPASRHPRPALLAFMAAALALPLASRSADRLHTRGGEVHADQPRGTGWSCSSGTRSGDGFVLAEITCRRSFPGGTVHLYAKDYRGPKETLEAVCARDWKGYYRPVLEATSKLEARIVTSEGRRLCAVDVEGSSAAGAAFRLSERYSVVPGHVLLTTAAGPADLLNAQEAAVAEWFEGVRFGAVRD
jgi:hypothetical protein